LARRRQPAVKWPSRNLVATRPPKLGIGQRREVAARSFGVDSKTMSKG
jgi:hypothetical protein